jgi:hypothetical protein
MSPRFKTLAPMLALTVNEKKQCVVYNWALRREILKLCHKSSLHRL